jgi:hypothetical protein
LAGSAGNYTGRMKTYPRGSLASKLRQRKFAALRSLTALPPDALLGSLAVHKRRCGKPTCRCADGDGHEAWSFTFMVEGRKRVLHVPTAWVQEVRRRVGEGRQFKDAITEVFAANAQLLAIELKQRSR